LLIRNSFLAYVDLLGTTYTAPTLATGFGGHIAQPLLREAYEARAGIDGTGELLTAEEAEKVIDDCMKVLYYRDARSINKVSCDCYMLVNITDKPCFTVSSSEDYREWGRGFRLEGL
jgi:20S proteasome subunit beta 7